MKSTEVRVFKTQKEMEDNVLKFQDEGGTFDEFNRWGLLGTFRVLFLYDKRDGYIEQAVMGLEINRIHCDIRINHVTMHFLLTRLRSRYNPVEPMHVFFKEIHKC